MDDVLEQDLTPRQIVERLDRYIIGQQAAKRAVALAMRARWRRQRVRGPLRDEIMPRNIILIGPTGVGKTEVARRLARLCGAPFLKIEASKFTEVGYVGRDVESMVRDLLEIAVNTCRQEASRRISTRTREWAESQLLEQLAARAEPERQPLDDSNEDRKTFIVGHDGVVQREVPPANQQALLLRRLRAGDFDEELVEIEVEPARTRTSELIDQAQAASPLGGVFEGMFQRPRKRRRVKVPEALRLLRQQEAERLLDMDQVIQDAIQRTEQTGIIFLDEIDKIVGGTGSKSGPDVSREGVQRDLLPIIEGSSVSTRHGVIATDHILFIAAGAFHLSRPSELIPELQGRFPIRVELESLSCEDFVRILTEPENALTRQVQAMLAAEDLHIDWGEGAVLAIAQMAWRANQQLENIGARRLHTVMERVFEELSFRAPEMKPGRFTISREYVHARLDGILEDEDMSRYVL